MAADGSIRVNTKLDTKPAQADLKKLEKECEKTAQKIEQVGSKIKTVFTGASKGQLNSAFKTANKELEKTEAALAAVENKIKEIQEATDKMLPEAATDEQTANLLAMEEAETAPLVKQREELAAKAADYKRQMEAITAELNNQANIEKAQADLKTGAKEGVADAQWLGKIQTEEQYQAALEQTRAQMAVIEQEAARIAQLSGVPVSNLLQQNTQYQTLARRAQLLADNQDKFKGKVNITTKEVQRLGTTMTRAFDKGLKRIMRMSVGLLGARSAFMALRRAASTYMEANEELKYQVEGLWNVLAVAIGPVVQQLVSWLTIAISYVNAFVKALWGVDLVAKANALALKKQAKATGEAAKASNQLAGFDEMNKLNDTNSGSSGAEAGAGQFKSVSVNTKFIDDIIKKLNVIMPIVWGIAAGFAAWKIASFFTDDLGKIVGWTFIITGAVTAILAFIEMLDGIEWGELGVYIGGIAVLATGLGIAFGSVAAAIGVIVGGIGAVVAGFIDWIKNGASPEALAAIQIGLLAIATAIGVILFVCIEAVAWWAIAIAAGIGLIAGAIVAVIMYWNEVKAWIKKNIIDPMAWFFDPLIEAGKKAWAFLNDYILTPIKKWFEGFGAWVGKYILNPLLESFGAIRTSFLLVYDKVKEILAKIKEIVIALAGAFKTYIWDPFAKWLGGVWNKFYAAIKPIIDWAKGVISWVNKNIITPLKNLLNSLANLVGTAISGAIKGVVNGMFYTIESRINGFIALLNAAISLINKIPGVNITKVTPVSLPRLAKGGIVNNPGRGVPVIAGEAGAEAVLPLENNTEWMDKLAEKINGGAAQIVIPIYLGSRKIAEEIIDLTKQRNFATNGAI